MRKVQSKVFSARRRFSGETQFRLLRNSFRSIVSNSVRPRIRRRFLNGPPVDPCVSQRESLPTFVTLFDATSVVVVADTSLSLSLSRTECSKNTEMGPEETRRIYMLAEYREGGRSEPFGRKVSKGGSDRAQKPVCFLFFCSPALRATKGAQQPVVSTRGVGPRLAFPSVRCDNTSASLETK